MYGLINQAIEDLVTTRFSPESWEEIRERAGIDVEIFVTNESYPDEVTYRLIEASAEVLELPAAEVLETFGRHWVRYTAKKGYGLLLEAAGKSARELILNLPDFHGRVSLIFPHLAPPSFKCSDIREDSLCLHYITHRPGLVPMLVGLVRGIGELHGEELHVEHTSGWGENPRHEVLRIRFPVRESVS